MSESDSFIHEVSEEVRRDRLFALVRRYAWVIAAVVLVIVGAAALNEWRKARSAAAAEAAGDALREAYLVTDPAARADRLEKIEAEHPDAAVVARIAKAGSLEEAGDPAAAAALLEAIAGEGAVPELYRALASLQRVMLLGNDMPASERQATLALLSADGAPFRPLALEQRALMQIEAGDDTAAVATLRAVIAAPGAPEALVARARQLIIAAGGELAPAPPSSEG